MVLKYFYLKQIIIFVQINRSQKQQK